jgi:HSP20 family protein
MFSLMPFRKERRAERGLAPIDFFRREFGPLFDRAFGSWPTVFELPEEWVVPYGLEMEEKEGKVVIHAELPGFEPGEIDVRVVGNLLTIVAEHKEEPPKGKGEKKPIEHRYGKVERTVTLPGGVLPDKAEAKFRNGVLELSIPLAPEVQPKRIEVKT